MGSALDDRDAGLARGYLGGLAMVGTPVETVRDWRQAEAVLRAPAAGARWWDAEEAERRRLMRQSGDRLGSATLLEALTDAVDGHAESTFGAALASSGDEALAKVASGAALAALHLRALALIEGCGETHAFVQKYALFDAGRFPLGLRGNAFIVF